MTAAEQQPGAGAPERIVAFTVPDALYQALLDICESHGWSADAGLRIAVEHSVRFLQGAGDCVGRRSVSQRPRALTRAHDPAAVRT
jgi:hypothetical protein